MDKVNFMNFVEVLAARAPAPGEEDKPGPDGLIYCHKCHKPKQYRVRFFEEERIVPINCECLQSEVKIEREQLRRMQDPLYQEALSERTEAQKKITFAAARDTDGSPLVAAQNFVRNFAEFRKMGKGLLFHGPVGTGKTYIAHCIVNELLEQGIPGMITNFARISNIIQGKYSGKQGYIDRLNHFPLLVIDDLGAERSSDYMKEIAHNVIDGRMASALPTIFTTNLSIEQIKKPADIADQRIYDRVLEMAFPIEVAGNSRRRKKVRDSYEETKRLLGLEEEG